MSTSRLFTYDNLPVGFQPDAIPVGSMITNVHDPLENILRPSPPLDTSYVSEVSAANYSRVRKQTQSFSFKGFLSKILTCGGNTAFSNQNELAAKAQVVRQLANYESAFHKVVTQSPEAQTWLQAQVQMHRYVLVVVRVYVYTGATRTKQSSSSKGGNASVDVPLTPIAGGTAAETVTGGLTDAGASAQGATGDDQTVKYDSDGPRVYGLSFRLVEATWIGNAKEGSKDDASKKKETEGTADAAKPASPTLPEPWKGEPKPATTEPEKKEGEPAKTEGEPAKKEDDKKAVDDKSVVILPVKPEVSQGLLSLAFRGRKAEGPRLRLKLASRDTTLSDLRSKNVREHVIKA